jgi:GGDEF domain-containing protein
VELGARLREAIRPSDTIARFGGDEYVVLCEDIKEARDAVVVGERIVAAAVLPFTLARVARCSSAHPWASRWRSIPRRRRRRCYATPTRRCTARRSAAAAASRVFDESLRARIAKQRRRPMPARLWVLGMQPETVGALQK